MTRRALFGWLGGAAGAALAALVAIPGAIFVADQARVRRAGGGPEPPGRDGDGDDVLDVGPLAALKEGEPTRVALTAARRRDGWALERDVPLGAALLVRRGDAVSAFSAVCPHAGCAVDGAPGGFACPCHRSRFALDGARLEGPAPRGLDPLPVEVRDGRVRLRWVRYRQGTAGREKV